MSNEVNKSLGGNHTLLLDYNRPESPRTGILPEHVFPPRPESVENILGDKVLGAFTMALIRTLSVNVRDGLIDENGYTNQMKKILSSPEDYFLWLEGIPNRQVEVIDVNDSGESSLVRMPISKIISSDDLQFIVSIGILSRVVDDNLAEELGLDQDDAMNLILDEMVVRNYNLTIAEAAAAFNNHPTLLDIAGAPYKDSQGGDISTLRDWIKSYLDESLAMGEDWILAETQLLQENDNTEMNDLALITITDCLRGLQLMLHESAYVGVDYGTLWMESASEEDAQRKLGVLLYLMDYLDIDMRDNEGSWNIDSILNFTMPESEAVASIMKRIDEKLEDAA